MLRGRAIESISLLLCRAIRGHREALLLLLSLPGGCDR
jgi:hypothetical protein